MCTQENWWSFVDTNLDQLSSRNKSLGLQVSHHTHHKSFYMKIIGYTLCVKVQQITLADSGHNRKLKRSGRKETKTYLSYKL